MTSLYNREYYLKNKEKFKEAAKKYYRTHKEKAYESARKSYLKRKDTEEYKLERKKTFEKYRYSPKSIYKIIKQNSKRRKYIEILSQEEFLNWYKKQDKICFYCKIPETMIYIQKSKRLEVDRLDNNLPYIESNIALACEWCNGVKGNILTMNEMIFVGRSVMMKRWQK